VAAAGRGVVVHIADRAPDRHLSGHDHAERDLWLAGQILADIGVSSVCALYEEGERSPDLGDYGFAALGSQSLDFGGSRTSTRGHPRTAHRSRRSVR
jgi:hypothetical protein